MRFTETNVSYPFTKDLTQRLLSPMRIIHLEQSDIDFLFTGKNGVMIEASQEEEDNSSFIKLMCEIALGKDFVKNSSSILVCIEMGDENPLMMEELSGLNDFFGQINAEIRWGVSNIHVGNKLKIIIISM